MELQKMVEFLAGRLGGNERMTMPDLAAPEVLVVPKDKKMLLMPSAVARDQVTRQAVLHLSDLDDALEYVQTEAERDGVRPLAELCVDGPKMEARVLVDAREDGDMAGLGMHHVWVRLKASAEWSALDEVSKTYHSQESFAEWLEDWADLVVEPSQANVLEVARSLTVHTDQQFLGKVNLHNGSVALRYEKSVKGSAEVEIPETIVFAVQPFTGLDFKHRVEARFRFRQVEQKAMLGIRLVKVERMWEMAAERLLSQFREKGIESVRVTRFSECWMQDLRAVKDVQDGRKEPLVV